MPIAEDPADFGKKPETLKRRKKCRIEADRSDTVRKNGELAYVPRVFEHRWQQCGIKRLAVLKSNLEMTNLDSLKHITTVMRSMHGQWRDSRTMLTYHGIPWEGYVI